MTQTTFPEIQAAAEALESRIALTETEIAQMKERAQGEEGARQILAQGTHRLHATPGRTKEEDNIHKGRRSLNHQTAEGADCGATSRQPPLSRPFSMNPHSPQFSWLNHDFSVLCLNVYRRAQLMTETLSIRLDKDTKKRLDALAKRSRRSKSFLAAEAIAAYVESEEWQLGELQAGIAELDAGKGVSHERVSKWLKSWGKPGVERKLRNERRLVTPGDTPPRTPSRLHRS